MPESKHALKSKTYITALVGFIASLLMIVLREHGYNVVISADMQAYASTLLFGAFMWLRQVTSGAIHFKPKSKSAEIAKERLLGEEFKDDT